MVEEDTVPWGLLGPFEISLMCRISISMFVSVRDRKAEEVSQDGEYRLQC